MGKTLYEKVYDAHVAVAAEGETPILYIDRHLVHEVTSPQAFDGLREKVVKFVRLAKRSPRWITTYRPQPKTSTPLARWRVSKWKRYRKTAKSSVLPFTT